jgi:enoyl-CoA hydratase/carnithine racemase
MTDSTSDSARDELSDEVVQYAMVDGVAWLTINRPDTRNALNAAVRAGLFEGVERFNCDDSARVLVLTGVGDVSFCAGADLEEMAATGLEVPPADFLPHFGRNVMVEKPTIAAVNGLAYAGGFLLAQMCDLCVAAEHARFAITEVKVGRGAPWAVPLPTMIPQRVALEILLTGEPIDAARAHEIGLVNRVVPAAELRASVQHLATTIAANAPLSVLAAKAMVRAVTDPSTHDPFTVAEEIWKPVYLSDDAQEGPRAFREKRPPRWTGH